MSASHGLEYRETIDATVANATAILLLTLQDLLAGGFLNPLEKADPSNLKMVAAQLQKMRDHPERYSGFFRDGKLVAYMKQNDWTIHDELPFAKWYDVLDLMLVKLLRMDPYTGMWGVFGLVASDELNEIDRRFVLTTLLESSFGKRSSGKERIDNIILHKNDPLIAIVPDYGFIPFGRSAEAAGAKGLKQRRYIRIIRN